MTEDNNTSLIPIGSTALVRVGNSIGLSSKLIEEYTKRQLEKVKFKGLLTTEYDIGADILSTASYQFEEFIVSTNQSSIFNFNVTRNQIYGYRHFYGSFKCILCGFIFDAIASGKNIYIHKNGNRTNTLIGHTGEIHTLVLSIDKKLLFSSSGDKSIRVWDTNSFECIKVLEGHELLVNSLVTDSNNRYLYSGGWDSYLIKWDIQTYTEVDRFYSGQTGGIRCIAILKNNQTIITGGGDKIVRLTDSKNHKIVAELKAHTDFVSCLAISEDNSLIASGGWDGSVNVWHLDARVLIKNLKAHSGHVTSLCFSGEHLLTAGNEGFIRTWK